MHNKVYLGMAATILLAGIAGGTVYGVNEVNKLNDKYNAQVEENVVLQDEVDTLTSDKTALQARVTTLTSEKTGLQTQLTAKSSQLDAANARIAELVAQAEENNEEFQFGTYVSSTLANGYYDDTFAEINNDGTGRIFFYDENGEMGFEPFTYRQENDKIYVDMIDEETQEVACTYELTLSNGYFDMIVEEGEEPMRFVYCNQELHDAILTRHNLRWQVVRLSNQITTLTDRIAELEAQQGENRAEYTVTRRQNITIGVGGSGLNTVIQSKTGNSILTEESTFSGPLNGCGLFGIWDSASSGSIEIIDDDIYTFNVDEHNFDIETTVNSNYYSTAENVSPETHIYVNGTEVTSEEEFSTMSSSYVTMFHQVDYELNENNELTSLVISTYITGEIEQENMDDPSEPEEQTKYTIQTNVTYEDETGVYLFRFADDGTFDSVQDTATITGRYIVIDTNYYTLYVNDTEYGHFVPTSADSFELNGTTYTVQTVAPGGEN